MRTSEIAVVDLFIEDVCIATEEAPLRHELSGEGLLVSGDSADQVRDSMNSQETEGKPIRRR